MNADVRRQAFVHSTRRRDLGSTGLGLHILYNIGLSFGRSAQSDSSPGAGTKVQCSAASGTGEHA
jgi:signal transduction histidine kinase